ncbi:helix-turn-helix domain-containing protein [Clostridium botulinum]|uniref:Excisionase n=1 Tax=Clostridium botulinum CFSAN001627 TaxID=1232189 RepID=M1ZRQ5_CLOBO|nr:MULTISPECIES: helix-turn-helix domain-containing protein [Clostridium]EKN42477.1 excisionase [Clostridium botulinum CFSAN001627]MBY6756119.1 helix-turn-helix domain-containing protein [Clostridium botulinum]MBY6907827.1 helix-turn-helix domain-containing protein [Clostridium botulinum]MBY6922798.1 helix-turn-helix domain-containing protein [Clostridium botulinum]MCW6084558.1 helix-turn-helix domain-containing protein [Clostridium sporogenes]
MEDYIYTVDEVASILKVNKNTVYDLIRSGNLIALKLGRLKITKATLLKFLKDFNGKDLTNLDDIKELIF